MRLRPLFRWRSVTQVPDHADDSIKTSAALIGSEVFQLIERSTAVPVDQVDVIDQFDAGTGKYEWFLAPAADECLWHVLCLPYRRGPGSSVQQRAAP
jgi:hypothetical protein